MAATLTDPQIAAIKLDLGDSCDKFSAPQIQAAYDAADGDDCGVRAILWRSIWMGSGVTLKSLVNGQQVSTTAALDANKDRFDFWNDCWDQGTNTLQVGSINLGIDTTTADLDDPNATWLWGDVWLT